MVVVVDMEHETNALGWIGWISVVCSIASAMILAFYLVKRPALVRGTKLALLFGVGVLPIFSAASVNVRGFQAMQSRHFCGSCHVMKPYEDDSNDRASTALASIHARNENFGSDNCYTCHEDYGMYGFALTKLGGMRHVYYYLTEYQFMTLEQSKAAIHIRAPLPNANCMGCHTTTGPRWLAVADHAGALDLVRSDAVSCASAGCHGYAHPFSKSAALGGEPR